MQTLLEQETVIRLWAFVGLLAFLAVWEALAPRKSRQMVRLGRWFTNAGLVVLGAGLSRLLVPVLAIGMAQVANDRGWGLLAFVDAPLLLEVLVALVMLDGLIYVQHVLSHKIPVLWRIHRVHHVDRDIDVTTGVRFHPIEIILSMIFKLFCVVLIGAPAVAVFVFELILNLSPMFNHSNIRLPAAVDRVLRWVIVTPDVHRVHHSVYQQETDSNYGFFLIFWDRLFSTYTEQPRDGHDKMMIGLSEYQNDKPASLLWSLLFPFAKQKRDEVADA